MQVPKPPSQSKILRGESNHVDIHRRDDGDLDVDIGDVHIHMHSGSSRRSPQQFPSLPPPVPHDNNFDAEKWVEEFVTRLQDGLSSLNENDDGTDQKQLPDSLPKNELKIPTSRSPEFKSPPDAHLGTDENHKNSPQTTARLLKRLRHRLESERVLRRHEKEEFKAEIEEKNAALKHFKKLCEKQRRKIEEISLRYEKREKRFQEMESAFVRHSETEIEELSRRNQNLNHEEYGVFLEKMMESCSEATARAVRLCVCVCVFVITFFTEYTNTGCRGGVSFDLAC